MRFDRQGAAVAVIKQGAQPMAGDQFGARVHQLVVDAAGAVAVQHHDLRPGSAARTPSTQAFTSSVSTRMAAGFFSVASGGRV
jgi:hypothetical protein